MDGGASWQLNQSLWQEPRRKDWLARLKDWADGNQREPQLTATAWERLTPQGLAEVWSVGSPPDHPALRDLATLQQRLRCLPTAQTDILCIKGGGSKHPANEEMLKQKLHKVSMNGREVYKFAVRSLTDAVKEGLAFNNLPTEQVTHVIAHQANIRIIDAVLERLEIPRTKAWLNIDRFGNTSSASLPSTLDEANRAGKLKPNDMIAMMAIGAGMSWGSAVVRW